jgi:Bifunctional DNA primase/polymerase, N-terminal
VTGDRMTCEQTRALAGRWAERDVPSFPIALSWDDMKQGINKRPLTEHGHHDATTDPAELDHLFNARSPKPGEVWGVGLWPGPAGWAVVDVDVKGDAGGDDTWAALTDDHGPVDTYTVTTASGGLHIWGGKGEHPIGNTHTLGAGIDLRSDDGWVVAPGVHTPWGSWDREASGPAWPPAPWPGWVLDRLTATNGASGPRGRWQPLDRAALHPADLAALEALEALGGHDAYLGGDGSVCVLRRGKHAGNSVSIGHIAPGVAKVFTSRWPPLLPDQVYDADQLAALANPAPAAPAVSTATLDQAHDVFRRWLGDEYDLDALDATLATAAAERLGGDPLWLLLVSGSGNAKTETVQALKATGAHVVSTIASDGALLSGTSKKQQTKDATGGLLRVIGDSGLLVIKDVTSILSMDRNTRATVLAAIREIHDGHWIRYLGVDGGRTLEWTGRIGIIGAVTTAWDRAHDVIASMGDRFLILRMDSREGRLAAGRQARRNVDHEIQMRSEMADVVAGVLAGAATNVGAVTDRDDRLLAAANLVTLARTGVDYDHRGDVIDAHAPESPTRFMKQLVQVVRGAESIGIGRADALRLAIRCARDSMPPLRLNIIDDLSEHPASTPTEMRRRLDKPRSTVDRQLQSLHILGVARLDEEPTHGGKTIWRYSLADGIDPATLRPSPDLLPHIHKGTEERDYGRKNEGALHRSSNKSGDGPAAGHGHRALVCLICGGPPDHPHTSHEPRPVDPDERNF